MLKFVILFVLVVLAVVGICKTVKAYRKERAVRAMVKKTSAMFEPATKLSPAAEYYASTVQVRR